MTAEKIVGFSKEESFSSPKGNEIIKQNSTAVLKEVVKMDDGIRRTFKYLVKYTKDSKLKEKLQKVFTKVSS